MNVIERSCAIEIALSITHQTRPRTYALSIVDEAMKHGLLAGLIQLEYRSIAVSSAEESCAVSASAVRRAEGPGLISWI